MRSWFIIVTLVLHLAAHAEGKPLPKRNKPFALVQTANQENVCHTYIDTRKIALTDYECIYGLYHRLSLYSDQVHDVQTSKDLVAAEENTKKEYQELEKAVLACPPLHKSALKKTKGRLLAEFKYQRDLNLVYLAYLKTWDASLLHDSDAVSVDPSPAVSFSLQNLSEKEWDELMDFNRKEFDCSYGFSKKNCAFQQTQEYQVQKKKLKDREDKFREKLKQEILAQPLEERDFKYLDCNQRLSILSDESKVSTLATRLAQDRCKGNGDAIKCRASYLYDKGVSEEQRGRVRIELFRWIYRSLDCGAPFLKPPEEPSDYSSGYTTLLSNYLQRFYTELSCDDDGE